jgi:hypothetical protein
MPYFDNEKTVYSSASLSQAKLDAINAGVERFDASPSALASFQQNYEPSGNLQIPMLLSDERDPTVPGFNQASYQAAVTAKGAEGFLGQREVPAYGHCASTPDQIGTALSDLILWGQNGVKPTP